MASQTEGTVISDVVQEESEGANLRSRDRLLVDANQTLVIGSVCQKGIGGRMKAMAAGVDEVQLIGITGTLSAGSFTLGIPQIDGGVVWTDPIAFNGNTAAIQAGIDTTPGGSAIVVSGTAITAMVFTFSGATHAGVGHDLIQVNTQGLTGEEDTSITRITAGGRQAAMTDEVQTCTCTLTPDGGTYTLSVPHWNGTTVTTAPIDWDANAATIEAAVDTAFGLVTPAPEAGSISVAGTKIGDDDIVLTYDGEEYEGRDWPLATVDAALLLDGAVVCSATFAETTKGGEATGGEAAGICLENVTTAAVYTTKAVFLTRDAVVKTSGLNFHGGNKIDCIARLEALGIVCREEPA